MLLNRVLRLAAAVALLAVAAGCGGSKQTTDASFASSKNCRAVMSLDAEITSVASAAAGTDPSAVQRQIQALAAGAPSDVKGDFETLAGAFSSYVAAAKKSGYSVGSDAVPNDTQIADLVRAGRLLTTAKVTAAEERIRTWEIQSCT